VRPAAFAEMINRRRGRPLTGSGLCTTRPGLSAPFDNLLSFLFSIINQTRRLRFGSESL